MAGTSLAFRKSFQGKQKTSIHGSECLSFTFQAMASPCQVLVKTLNLAEAKRAFSIVEKEAKRIERKYSRYLADGIVSRINNSRGRAIEVDTESAALLNFADECFHLSNGAFDITSGALRKIWKFEKKNFKVPSPKEAKLLLQNVGWKKLSWKSPYICLPEGMPLDFGGIGKEYAVDRCYLLLKEQTQLKFLLNFGGDIIVSGPQEKDIGWIVGVEDANSLSNDPRQIIELKEGALATSGNTKRFITQGGKSYGHILNTQTGFPVEGAPKSVTVAGKSCLDAGMLSTFAMLSGKKAEEFLKEQDVKYWIQW